MAVHNVFAYVVKNLVLFPALADHINHFVDSGPLVDLSLPALDGLSIWLEVEPHRGFHFLVDNHFSHFKYLFYYLII